MSAKQIARDFRAHLAAMGVALGLAYLGGATAGLAGMALGLVATTFSLLALWFVIRLTTSQAEAVRPTMGTFIVLLAFVVKVPLFLWMGSHAQRLGGPAPTCFLLGLGLVYCLMVAWALGQS